MEEVAMILKYKTTKRVDEGDRGSNYDQWNFVDNITNCSVYFNPTTNCTCIDISHGGEYMSLALHEEAYLINDAGKTIEKIAH
jgi:hypothetical protein